MRPKLFANCVLTAGLVLTAGAAPYRVAMLEIEGDPPAASSAVSMFAEAAPTVLEYADALRDAASDDGVSGIIVRLKDAALSTTDIAEIGQAMDDFRASGKDLFMFAEAYGTAELLTGCHADHVILQQGGGVTLPGIYMEEMFLADMLEWVGVEADFVQVGDYKGANEMYENAAPSEAWDQNISSLLDAMYADMRDTLKTGRGLDDAALDEAMAKAWLADGRTAMEAGLIDAEVDLADLLGHVEAQAAAGGWAGDEFVYAGDLIESDDASADMSNPLLVFSQLFQPVQRRTTGPTIAVLHIDGAIMDGDSTPEGPFSSASVGSRTIRNAIKQIRKDDNIEGVVVRIDSPGGSAIASEVIWQGLRRLGDEKPVWVSVGSMAASGGYYIAVGGQKIFVNEASIVGSIGVVGGKLSFAQILEKARVNIVPRARGPHADMFGMTTGWDSGDLSLVREKMTETYELFTSRVSEGRPGIDLGKTAEGRLFLGEDAVGLNMADEVGTLSDALDALAADLALDDYEVMDFPEPPSLEDMISQALGGFVAAPVSSDRLGLLRELLGERRFASLRDAWTRASMLRTEPVLLTAPSVLSIE
jgi:protease-4